jgi:hypothetical protein
VRLHPSHAAALFALIQRNGPRSEMVSEHQRQCHSTRRFDCAARDVIQVRNSDNEWTAIEPMLSNKPRGVRVLDGIR